MPTTFKLQFYRQTTNKSSLNYKTLATLGATFLTPNTTQHSSQLPNKATSDSDLSCR